ncbi:MAG TPA: lytic transglycosylase domain-containing protein [Candidatus Angelobacter sp.]|nr:lytic transglycosylase domain-containing protein [Candidatus Angelobacter sp.]
MSVLRPIGIALLLIAGQLSASAADLAILKNGSSIPFLRKEVSGSITRLYIPGGHLDIPSDQISSYDKDDSLLSDLPPDPQPAPAAQPVSATATTPVSPAAVSAVEPSVSASPSPAMKASRADIDVMVKEIAARYQLDPDFVASVIKAESDFNPHAISRKGAQGLMQLMPQTATQLGVKDAFDPKANVQAGTAHLNALLEQYHDDPVKALAAYNAGAHRVQQYHGVPPYRETRAYVAAIIRDFNAKKRAELRAEAARKKASQAAKTQQKAKSIPKQTQAQQQASASNLQSTP